MSRRPVAAVVAVLATATLGGGAACTSPSAAAAPSSASAASTHQPRPAVVERRVIGHSVLGRPIVAWRLGDTQARTRAVAIAALHGNEVAPGAILQRLRDGAAIKDVDLWVVPVANPDGVARGQRRNAHGVDLNRNFPRAWARLDGAAGTGPASEPETRALMRLIRQVDPRFVVSLHQPLDGVDLWHAKKRRFVRRLADQLRLPLKEFACGGTCHGTLTQWFNHGFAGAAVTVEFPARPSWERLNVRAPRQLLRALGGSH